MFRKLQKNVIYMQRSIRAWDCSGYSELRKSPAVCKYYFIYRLKPNFQLGHCFMVNSVWSQNNSLKIFDMPFLNKLKICSIYPNLFELPEIGRWCEIRYFKNFNPHSLWGLGWGMVSPIQLKIIVLFKDF